MTKDIKKPTLAENQDFWAEQLPLFKEAYWLPEHFELLKFDMEAGNFVVRDDIDPAFEDDAGDLYHRINTGWSMWKRAVNLMQKKLEGCVVVPSHSVNLTCEQLLTALQYGAPDLVVERTEYSDEQMETEMSIVWLEDGHSGSGYYAYYTDLPEEGSINLDLMGVNHESI